MIRESGRSGFLLSCDMAAAAWAHRPATERTGVNPSGMRMRRPLGLLLLAASTSAFRLIDRRGPAGAGDSYIAAVGQTIFSDGGAEGGCCPTVPSSTSPEDGEHSGACPGAEPLGALPPCKGTPAQAMNATKMGNVATFERMMEAAAAKGAQIIVFGEGALGIADGKYKSGGKMVDDGGGVAGGLLAEPLPEPLGAVGPIVPCDWTGAEAAAAPALVAISCAAKKHKIHVVYDTGDAVKCAPKDPYNSSEYCYQCPPEGIMRFNTQVAIGDNGTMLAKYHKTHRYLAAHCIGDGYQQPGGKDPRWFDTSFGVRFGMMLCYDICFHTPAIELAVSANQISDFVFSTHWENEEGPPISLATSFFQSWSRGVGANLLAANEGMGLMHTGSGIFSQGDALASAWEPANPHDEALLIATVPKLHGKSMPMYAGGKPPAQPWGSGPLSPNGPVFTTIAVSADGKNYHATVSDAKQPNVIGHPFSCSVNFTTTAAAAAGAPLETEQYALVGVNGSWISSRSGGLPARGCALYRIPASSISAAGGVDKWKPWNVDKGAPLYRTPLNTTVAADLGGSVSMQALSIVRLALD